MFSRANSKSDKMVYQARKNKLGEIFEKLDHDRDGEISSNSIDIMGLPDYLVRIFKPLFKELDILGEPLVK